MLVRRAGAGPAHGHEAGVTRSIVLPAISALQKVDAERDKLIDDLRRSGSLRSLTWIDGFQTQLKGSNGGGDPCFTDGRLALGGIRMGD